MKSIRIFLVIILIAIVTLANFIAALRGYTGSMAEAEKLFDQRLLQQAELLAYSSTGQASEQANRDDESAFNDQSLQFQIISDAGTVIDRSASMPDKPVTDLIAGLNIINFNNYRWHVLVYKEEKKSLWIIVAERNDQRYLLAESMILKAVFPMVIAIPIIGLIIWLVVGFGLRPINRLASEFRQREANDLSIIKTTTMPAEFNQLIDSANELLRRLDASFEREKRFSADAAHELRTPIAAMKIHCDNLLQEMPSPSVSAINLQQGIERMSYLVEQILSLNRMSPDHFMGRFEPLNLTQLLKQQVAEQSFALHQHRHTLEFEGDECWIMGDSAALITLLNNLLGNAIKYTPKGGKIHVATWLRDHQVVLEIMDNGSGIAPDSFDRVFDRFYRLDGDRNNSNVLGCGLGLSIVKQVVDLHGAKITLTHSRFATGLLVIVSFAAAQKPLQSGQRTIATIKDNPNAP
jgi:two-component system sensor histidine kinase QseC